MKTWLKPIKRMRACEEAIAWGENYETLEEAWAKCERGDWMLWLCGRLSGEPESDSRKKLVLAACECARLSLPYVREGEERPLKTIETAEQYARGGNNITLTMVRDAAAAAYAAADAASVSAYAADAAYAAYAAADAAYAAAYAYAAAAAARTTALEQCADIVRKHYPVAPVNKEGGIKWNIQQ